MRLVTYLPPGAPDPPPGAPEAGRSLELDARGRAAGLIEREGEPLLVDLQRAAATRAPGLPRRLLGLLVAGPDAWALASELLDEAAEVGTAGGQPLETVAVPADSARLLAPLPAPASLRDFSAFEEHVRRGFAARGEDIPPVWHEQPVYYKGNHRSILGPGDEIPWPAYTRELDYELELAMVVGRPGRDLDEQRAAACVFGYTLMNDLSARDIQRREMAARLGPAKGKDFGTVLGPVLVTADELDPGALRVRARIDGAVVTDTTTAGMRWSFAQMIAHVSQAEDVLPGDVYGSGTVGGGCGLEHGRLLQPGEVVELEADGIGTLRNRVGTPPA